MKRLIGAVGALLIHLMLLLSLLPIAPTQVTPPTPTDMSQQAAKKLKGGQSLVEAEIIAPEGLQGPSCASGSYVGIGILVGWGGTVKSVGENTPASRAGVLEGDIITNESDLDTSWKGGEAVILHLLRGGEKVVIGMKVEKICYES